MINSVLKGAACRARKRTIQPLRTSCAVLFLLTLMSPIATAQSQPFTVAWWNVENLFDTRDDPRTHDDDFTPRGELHWNRTRLDNKLRGIYRTLTLMDLPDVVGLGEVENDYVLRELTGATPLVEAGYSYVHFDSPDRRGIDCALIYRRDRFTVTASGVVSLSDSAEGFFTRDILQVEGRTPEGDTLCFLVNHWPSKRGGDEAEARRLEAAQTLRRLMVDIKAEHPGAAVVAMGDFNCTSDEAPISHGMAFGTDSINPDGIRNLTLRLPKAWGSHKFQGLWDYLDQMFILADEPWMVGDIKVMRFDHLLTHEQAKTGQRPKRTYQGTRYEAGLSDHLPLLLRLKKQN